MQLFARPLAVVSALALCLNLAAPAVRAAGLEPLSDNDQRYYQAAFGAAERGDFDAAEAAFANTRDRSLIGKLSFTRLMHPSAYSASYDDLTGWLKLYGDEAGADRVYALALKRKPARAAEPKPPELFVGVAQSGKIAAGPADKGRAAREAYYSGDVKTALKLAKLSGERWIAGLSSFRLESYADARGYFEQVAHDEGQDDWLRAAAAFWAARSAGMVGDKDGVRSLLNQAAQAPQTFYGMIAGRQLAMAGLAVANDPDDPIAALITRVSYSGPDPASLSKLLASDIRARRAASLAQLGRWNEAGAELRAGLSLAADDKARADWSALTLALNARAPFNAGRPVKKIGGEDYPLPELAPKGGFTISKALVYALVRQESRFDPMAVSGAGAVGLMQLMPVAAARAAGDDKLLADNTPLFDPAFNLRVGQDYFTWLMDRGLQSPDILRAVAAYNGGPGTLLKVQQQLGADCDSLLLIESLPAVETRNYVEKVMASYWTYRRLLGAETKTLDAVASGQRVIDFRLDM
ncbi:lytic transglycosylase domain-containing protein [Caulobacter hibisci]|uniref:Lytic transglycosylase domain-containing protein n=1 Tax=Caulobacter hibisci TaxID=2035993 RepID=A0ABS0SWI5_9CAUL|nr:lytic transglycosylase domain-containing protein [Caulobacter hibisci]MBI1683017.1 lytic transglycosylase domain-containing protein [Caulobacter hibisci]